MRTDISNSQCTSTTVVETAEALIDDTKNLTNNIGNDVTNKKSETKSNFFNFETDIIWSLALLVAFLHVVGIYGIFTFDYVKNPMTTLWIIAVHVMTNLGVCGGAHRLWSHKSYKAKLPIRILYMILYLAAGQNSIYSWVKNHRMHHKYCDTDADPHNTNRGFFYTHFGWVFMKEHPEYIKKSKQIDLSDIMSDPVVVFAEKYFLLLQLCFGFVLPTLIPVYCWNETWSRAIMSQVFIRYIITLNIVWSVNSISHAWGYKPYDKNVKPVDNEVINYLTMGEGYHNYHHVFPWDYRSAETGYNKTNYTTLFINTVAKLGLIHDLKYPSDNLIRNTILNRGDGTHPMLFEVNTKQNSIIRSTKIKQGT